MYMIEKPSDVYDRLTERSFAWTPAKKVSAALNRQPEYRCTLRGAACLIWQVLRSATAFGSSTAERFLSLLVAGSQSDYPPTAALGEWR